MKINGDKIMFKNANLGKTEFRREKVQTLTCYKSNTQGTRTFNNLNKKVASTVYL